MRRFRTLKVFAILILTFFWSQKTYALNTYQAGQEIIGQEYNDALEKWFHVNFSMWAGISNWVDSNKHKHSTEYIFFLGKTGLGNVTVRALNTKETREKLKKALEKAIEWSKVARKNQVDTSKGLGCFGEGFDSWGGCTEDGAVYRKNRMGLSFFATSGGKQTNLIIRLIDQDNQFIKTTVYLDFPKMEKMLNAVNQIESAFEKARKTAKNKKLFK